jgi:hypothetical protein
MRRPFVLLFLLAAAGAQSAKVRGTTSEVAQPHPLSPATVRCFTISGDEPVNRPGVQTFCEESAASSESLF